MAFTVTSKSPTPVRNVGQDHFPRIFTGVVALSSGTATVKIPGAKVIVSAFASSQTANAARISDITGNVITITGTGTDVVMWQAFAQAQV